jgi:hypothetical protein
MTIFCFNPIEVISGRLNVWVTCGTCQENNDDISFTPVEVISGSGQMFIWFFFQIPFLITPVVFSNSSCPFHLGFSFYIHGEPFLIISVHLLALFSPKL